VKNQYLLLLAGGEWTSKPPIGLIGKRLTVKKFLNQLAQWNLPVERSKNYLEISFRKDK